MELFFKSLFVSLTFLLMLMMPQKVLTYTYFPVGKIAKKSSLKKHSKYSAMLSKIHSFRLPFRRFCPLNFIVYSVSGTDFLYLPLHVVSESPESFFDHFKSESRCTLIF